MIVLLPVRWMWLALLDVLHAHVAPPVAMTGLSAVGTVLSTMLHSCLCIAHGRHCVLGSNQDLGQHALTPFLLDSLHAATVTTISGPLSNGGHVSISVPTGTSDSLNSLRFTQ
jgi:hypothetical protein